MNVIPVLAMSLAWIRLVRLHRQFKDRRKRYRRWWVKPHIRENVRNQFGAFSTLFIYFEIYDHEEFYKMMRMTVQQFHDLHEMIKTRLEKSSMRRRPLPTKLRLGLCLHYFAHDDSIHTLSRFYYVGKSTTYGIIGEVSYHIWEVLSLRYLGMKTVEDWQKDAEEFEKRWGFPHCIGAVDGKHIRIVKPPRSGSTFYNYKKYFSFVLMAACDTDYRFNWIDVGDYGSLNDASIFAASSFGQQLQSNNYPLPPPTPLLGTNSPLPYFLIGDEAFTLSSYMMRPYSRRLATEESQTLFNYRLSRARMAVENAFGILAARWRILYKPLIFNLQTSVVVVQALICLHNFLLTSELDLPPDFRRYASPQFVDRITENGNIIEGQWRQDLKDGRADDVKAFENDQQTEGNEAEDEVLEAQVEDISPVGLRIREKLTFYFMAQEGYLLDS